MKTPFKGEPTRFHKVDFFDEDAGINDRAVGDDQLAIGVQDCTWHQVECKFLAFHNNGVTGVGSAVETNHHVMLSGQNVDKLAFALVPPLEADNRSI